MKGNLTPAIAALALAGAALAIPARAESLPPYRPYADYDRDDGPAPAWIACRPDVRRYCPNVLPGGGRILSCLAGNKDRLSYGCRESLLRAWAYHRRW